MNTAIVDFRAGEDGAVTVDWVVLTAGIVTLGVTVLLSVGGSTTDLADEIGTAIDDIEIATY